MQIKTVEPGQQRRYAAKSVVKVQRHSDGSVTRVVLCDRDDQPKVDKRYRKADKRMRKLVKAQNIASSEYLRRHRRSNEKKRNGALRDLPRNMRRSIRKGNMSL
jgi:hypothetical protein